MIKIPCFPELSYQTIPLLLANAECRGCECESADAMVNNAHHEDRFHSHPMKSRFRFPTPIPLYNLDATGEPNETTALLC